MSLDKTHSSLLKNMKQLKLNSLYLIKWIESHKEIQHINRLANQTRKPIKIVIVFRQARINHASEMMIRQHIYSIGLSPIQKLLQGKYPRRKYLFLEINARHFGFLSIKHNTIFISVLVTHTKLLAQCSRGLSNYKTLSSAYAKAPTKTLPVIAPNAYGAKRSQHKTERDSAEADERPLVTAWRAFSSTISLLALYPKMVFTVLDWKVYCSLFISRLHQYHGYRAYAATLVAIKYCGVSVAEN